VKRITIAGIPVDMLTMNQTIRLIDAAIEENRPIHHVVINAAKVVNAQTDMALRESIINCDIINADGQSIVWASQILNKPLPERVPGIDLMVELIKLASQKKYKIFFLGAKEEVVKKVVDKYSTLYGNEIIAGYRNGYFDAAEENEIANQIATSKAQILFVAMTSPKKEIFLNKFKNVIQTPFIMGVGGSFDVVGDFITRAPLWMQHSGLEWLYRTIQEPKRMWKRYLVGNSKFIYLVLREKSRQIFKKKKPYEEPIPPGKNRIIKYYDKVF
jgi:N-acetylglucosaminyldiphosphoundecaprenol N-acetyl-beta-D-mannosaminyltransferase